MKTRILSSVAAIALTATAAAAGNYTPPPADPVIAPITPVGPDWTGFYFGVQGGFIDVDTNTPPIGGDGGIFGITAGYDYDIGRAVLGIGLDYDWTDITLLPGAPGGAIGVAVIPPTPPLKLESVFRIKLKSGIEFGNGLGYLTGGYALADTNLLGEEDGWYLGLGYEHLVGTSFSIGGEVLYHEFDNYANTPVDVDATTFQIRGAYRF
ncbi:MAG: outer membrane beta-barrel protein [Pseudomonadota bacterium]